MPPRRVGAVAKDVQQALQVALRERMSRMEIRLPRGARLGTERRSSEEETDSEAGDREVGRILAGMFEKTGLSVCVVFDSERARRRAEKMWGPVAECETAAWECSKGRKKGKTRKSGFGRDDGKTKDFDVYIVVGGGAGFVARVREVAQRVGMDTLVILANVNARNEVMPVDLQKYREANFKWVYFYQPDPHPQVRGGVLFRKFPDGT